MTSEDKLKIQIARLEGEFVGTLEGILLWELPKELKLKIKEKIKEVESKRIK